MYLDKTRQIYNDIRYRLTYTQEEWLKYLRFAACIYKYRFEDAVMIYAQRPDAKMVAEFDTWKKIGRNVRRGSHGIVVFDNTINKYSISKRYLFDISDTYGTENTVPKQWKITTSLDKRVTYKLNQIYDTNCADLHGLIPYMIKACTDELQIMEYEPIAVKRDAVENSAAYMAYMRAGIKCEIPDVHDITKCSVLDDVTALGVAVHTAAKSVLDEISQTAYLVLSEEYEKKHKTTNNKLENHSEPNAEKEESVELVKHNETIFDGAEIVTGEQLSLFDDEGAIEKKEKISDVTVQKSEPEQRNITLHKVGDFYEVYGDEAVEAAGVLQIILTPKTMNGKKVPMTGFPIHAAAKYTDVLADKGYKLIFADNEKADFHKLEQAKEITITCEHSESPVFKAGQEYSVAEFDTIMKQADDRHIAGKKAAIEKYGTERQWYDVGINDDEFSEFLGYDKVRFTINMPTGERYTERQDIGDGYGGIIDFLKQYPKYDGIISMIEAAVNKQTPAQNSINREPNSERNIRTDFTYTDYDNIYNGGIISRYNDNIAAIKLLKEIECDNRLASANEQTILSKYVGWGGMPQMFDENADPVRYKELKDLLTDEEYMSARASTPTAFYTPQYIINEIYNTLQNFGFRGGNIIEPAVGNGNFFGTMPPVLRAASKLYATEKDSVSGRIAQQLYQTADIKIQGYETVDYPDNFFDVAISNIPFGSIRPYDARYSKLNLKIHDYFFAKSLDKVRPGGIIAFITSTGTFDKQNDTFRRYIAQRAELIGAVRLPQNTFKEIANTTAAADIIFLQKRERIADYEPDWLQVTETDDGIPVNRYYIDNPQMLLGKMEYDKRMFGEEGKYTTLIAEDNADIKELLHNALSGLSAQISDYAHEENTEKENIIPADANIANYTYAMIDDRLYYRENSVMRQMDFTGKKLERIQAMIEIRKAARKLIDVQTEGCSNEIFEQSRSKLNDIYDSFTDEYGFLNSKPNKDAFYDDADYPLLSSLESIDEETGEYIKAEIFYKRTIKPVIKITHADNADDALRLSLSERGYVDIGYMSSLCSIPCENVIKELKGQIYLNPVKYIKDNITAGYETADEYLSGNVREKLRTAKLYAEDMPELFSENVSALEKVQPQDVEAADISVKIGTPWISVLDYERFMYETFQTPEYNRCHDHESVSSSDIYIYYDRFRNDYIIYNKGADSSVAVNQIYGTARISAYEILEHSLNSQFITIYDIVYSEEKEKRVVNTKETTLARNKQQQIEEKFKTWLFNDIDRRNKYVRYYNDVYNNIRLRHYDGSHLRFDSMSNKITLREHQKDAVARIIYGDTGVLLAHVVGAGKTFMMAASCMELKRLGMAHKCMIVVPNHLTEQIGAEFLRLYPTAKILIATKKDFEKQNRLRFISKISTGTWDAVILGHTQFEKIPVSVERRENEIKRQLDEVVECINGMKQGEKKHAEVKRMETYKANLESRIERLADIAQDNLITFESLGVDYLFVDEAHYYKNCAVFSKMRNVAGVSSTSAKKSEDMLIKCRYIQEIQNGRGVVFATGTPVSNTMAEMFVMIRYLYPDALKERGIEFFDAWAKQFGEVISSLELAPEGTGYRMRNRFARFCNMPELMQIFHYFADVQTKDMLNLPVPEAEYEIIESEPSEFAKTIMERFAERAEKIRGGNVDTRVDNMLKITNEGRLLATDPRLLDINAPELPDSKVNQCADKVYEYYIKSHDIQGTQIVFCDVGTPSKDKFNVYDELKIKLIMRGIPEEQIVFIHDAKTEIQKEEIFEKLRNGTCRIILGSTLKMGTGTNIQNRLVALHHLDCPYRPSDIEQREGRILRFGNMNDRVHICRYVTKSTFDAYMWQMVESKQRFISQVRTNKVAGRTCEDIDETVLSFAEVKAIATGDERIKEKMNLDMEISRLRLLEAGYNNQRYTLQEQYTKIYPRNISTCEHQLSKLREDYLLQQQYEDKDFSITVGGRVYTERTKAGDVLDAVIKNMKNKDTEEIGEYHGFKIIAEKDFYKTEVVLRNKGSYRAEFGDSALGNITKIENLTKKFIEAINLCEGKIDKYNRNIEAAKIEYEKPFENADELRKKLERLNELNMELDLDDSGKNDDVHGQSEYDAEYMDMEL